MLTVRQKLKILDDDIEFVALFALIVCPGVVAKATLDKERASLARVLMDDFCAAAKCGYFDVGGVFALLAALGGVGAVHGEAEVADFVAGGEVFEFGVAGEVAHEDDFIHICHNWG